MENQPPTDSTPLTEKLVMVRQAFVQFRTRCFWYMRPDFVPTEEDVPRIAEGLRLHGGRTGWMLAAALCR